MTLFSFLFPGVAAAVWRARCALDPADQPRHLTAMSQLNAAASVAIITALVTALTRTRQQLKEVRDAIAPTKAELAALTAEDAEVEAALLSAKEALDAMTAEDTPPVEEPPAEEPATPPEDPATPPPADPGGAGGEDPPPPAPEDAPTVVDGVTPGTGN